MRKINWPIWLEGLVSWTVLFLALIGLCSVCEHTRRPPAPTVTLGLTPLPAPRTDFDWGSLYGWGSFYGRAFHGRKTADGTVYDMGGFSVAHKTMKLGTFVMITNLRTGRRCVAVVNDRGPYIEGRDWDVSMAVAKRLGMTRDGVVPLKIEVIL